MDGMPSFGLSRCFWHLKDWVRATGTLTPTELAFIGMPKGSSVRSGNGWRSAMHLVTGPELDSVLSPEGRGADASTHADRVRHQRLPEVLAVAHVDELVEHQPRRAGLVPASDGSVTCL
jgi:hypothetical protein